MVKKAFKIKDQVNLLQNKGLIVDDKCCQYLLYNTYYFLINGYRAPFIDNYKNFNPGTSLGDLKNLMSFDNELRNLMLRVTLLLEHRIKSVYAHFYSIDIGMYKYLTMEGYDKSNASNIYENDAFSQAKHWPSLDAEKYYNKRVADIVKLNGKIINKHILDHKDSVLSYHIKKYGQIPLFITINQISLNLFSEMFQWTNYKTQDNVAKQFACSTKHFMNMIELTRKVRNKAAHFERLYTFKSSGILPNKEYNLMQYFKSTSIFFMRDEYDNYVNDLYDLFEKYIENYDSKTKKYIYAMIGLKDTKKEFVKKAELFSPDEILFCKNFKVNNE